MAFKLDFIFSGLNVVGGYVEVSSPAISADEKNYHLVLILASITQNLY
ncbi:TPA: hypothetical protein ACP4TZ_003626 [Klebsiella pneumoniae]|nr:hypothetical protein [Klebsiella pneumoniae]